MADMREALRKAGLVTAKQVRQSRHEERQHRKDVGHEGLEREARERADRVKKEQEEKRVRDQQLEQERRHTAPNVRASGSATRDVVGIIASGLVAGATAGSNQYFFVLPSGRITYLELSDGAYRSLQSGAAAIVESLGAVRAACCVVTASAAREVLSQKPEVVLELVEPAHRH